MGSVHLCVTRCLASGCVEHLKIIQLFVQNICQACFPQAGTHFQSSALAEQGPTRREMGADPCHGCGVSSCSFPSPPPPHKPDSAPDAVSRSGLPPFPSAPQPPPCCLFLNPDGWAGSLPTASPGLVPPLHRRDHGEHVWELSWGQGRQAGETRLDLLLPLWLLGMFLSRNNSVPRCPVLVFSNVSAIKMSGLEWYEMNFAGILKPWLWILHLFQYMKNKKKVYRFLRHLLGRMEHFSFLCQCYSHPRVGA